MERIKVPCSNESLLAKRLIRDLVGINLDALTSVVSSKKAIWRLYGMRCCICGRGWDSTNLERHHFIPLRVGRALGLSTEQMNNPLNYKVVCQSCHNRAEIAIRGIIELYCPNLYQEIYGLT